MEDDDSTGARYYVSDISDGCKTDYAISVNQYDCGSGDRYLH